MGVARSAGNDGPVSLPLSPVKAGVVAQPTRFDGLALQHSRMSARLTPLIQLLPRAE
jgi:hypothetical protein